MSIEFLRRRLSAFMCGLVLPGLLVCAGAPALAAEGAYPARPVRIVVPQSPGGTTDLTGRLVASWLAERLGQPLIVDNRPGAGSLHGVDLVAKSAPDGHTLLVVASSLTIIPSTYRKVPFDPVRDFAPVATIATYPNVVVVHPSVAAASIQELVAIAKAKPGSLNFASGGVGTGTHLTAELFAIMAGIRMVHVPYKGGGPALTALMGGQVQLYFAAQPSTLAVLKTGKVRALAVTSARRSRALPDVPGIAETAGLSAYDEVTWNGLLAPARTPPAVVRRLHAEVAAALKLPATRERFAADGSETGGIRPEEFAALIKREIAKWARVTREAGIQPE
jgi:tripartite-type tricarboxylate transporter receptor subunit TctC